MNAQNQNFIISAARWIAVASLAATASPAFAGFESAAGSHIHGKSELHSVAYGNGVYTAVGASGSILVSTDAVTWSEAETETEATLRAVTHGAGHFVAVGGKGLILVSETGQTWEARASGSTHTLLDIKYGDGGFVAVGEGGVVVTSENALDWSAEASGTAKAIVSLAHGNGKFVAVAASETAARLETHLEREVEILVSSDAGVNWQIDADPEQSAEAVVFVDGEFILYGRKKSGGEVETSMRTSVDASVWVSLGAQLEGILADIGARAELLAAISGRVEASGFAAAENGAKAILVTGASIAVKTKGIAGSLWTEAEFDTGADSILRLNGAAHGTAGFVVVGEGGLVLHSGDGEEWTARTSAEAEARVNASAHAVAGIVAVGSTGGKASLHTSVDGSTWTTTRFESEADLRAVVEAEGKIVAVGSHKEADGHIGAAVFVSTDGETFAEIDLSGEGSVSLHGAVHGVGTFVAVHSESTVMVSADAESWSKVETGIEAETEAEAALHGVVFAEGRFVAVGDGGVILESADGQAWSRVEAGVEASLRTVTHANGVFVAAGTEGEVAVSFDGETWGSATVADGETILAVEYVNGNYVAVGTGGSVHTSLDAQVWTRQEIESDATLKGIAYADGEFHFVTEASGSLSAKARLFLNSAATAEGFAESVWFGLHHAFEGGVEYHAEHGFLFAAGENEQSVLIFHYEMDAWLRTGASFYPFVYKHGEDGGWLFYIEGSGDTYFDFAANGFITIGG